MIDLHCHMLPGLDDGPTDIAVSLEMARIATADGITICACTPHILPGLYDNNGPQILAAVSEFSRALCDAGIPLQVVAGADVHAAPDLRTGLRSERVLTLNGSRYLLFEPPHHVLPPRFEEFTFGVIAEGYFPIITHPERLTWIDTHYDVLVRLIEAGALAQLTAGSLTGHFGKRARYWSERMLDEGMAHILATDAHDAHGRPPRLAEARDISARRVGEVEAGNLVLARPQCVIANVMPSGLPRNTPRENMPRPASRKWFPTFN
ncbi:tyrosine-protein phosphatase [Microbaculum marinum]|uniref:protein-tyrosine-phosphatase n=1 Tax=Microbaculum marinum TaxID=1764581 RepID=A0AAW9RSQ8_9HYPH